jgi:hypothetical protein
MNERNDWTAKEAEWVETAIEGRFITAETAIARKGVNGPLAVWRACGRCGGTGYINAFGHVEGGVCFGCRGGKGRFVTIQKLAARARKAARDEKRAVEAARIARIEIPRAARKFLAENEGLAAALATPGVEIIRSFARQIARKGHLSAKQVETAIRIANEEAEKPAPVEIEAGRRELTGTVISVKEREGYAYGTIEWKMLVEIGPGARVFGSIPKAINFGHDLKGATVTFTATVEPKEAGFGFFSRPAKAKAHGDDFNTPTHPVTGEKIELDCGHNECAHAYAREIERVGEHTAEALCLPDERAEDAAYHEADAAATRREG